MLDVTVIENAAAAEASLDPIRTRLLAELASEAGSATTLARKVGLPRQKVNYHLRTLERHGLITLAEERRRGNLTERVLQATASAYVISPAALHAVEPDPSRSTRPPLGVLAPLARQQAGGGRRRAAHRRRQGPSAAGDLRDGR